MNIKDFILGYLIGKQDGGGGASVEPLTVTENGEYSEEGVAYSPVTVDVPNSYSAGDEGKVVSNGALVSQTSDTVTQNGTVDTTLINSLLVNVSSGGGASNVKTGTFTPSTAGDVEQFDTGYTGNGYPIAMMIVVDGGAYNPANTDWYNLVQNKVIGLYVMAKQDMDTAPDYTNTKCLVCSFYKNNGNTAPSSSGGSGDSTFFTQTSPSASNVNVAKMPDKKTVKYLVSAASESYGFKDGITYRYWVIYSE